MMTDAELTILSIVAEGKRFGAEIQQLIEERGLREWMTIGFASVYYILSKLERQKMVRSELRPDARGPARKVYEITEAGLGILQTAVSNLLRQPRPLGSGFELGLVNLGALRPLQAYQVLLHHLEDLRRQIKAIEHSWDKHQREESFDATDNLTALYTHSLALMRAELAWLEDFIRAWENRHPEVKETPSSKLNPATTDDHSAPTVSHRNPTPEPAKMLQRLKRPKKD